MSPAGPLDAVALVVAVFVTVALAVILTIALLNAATFPRLRPAPGPASGSPAISVLVPARDEAATIGTTVEELLRQDPPPLEVIVLDDGSTDGTAEAALAAAARVGRDLGADAAARLRLVTGEPLPDGWAGKAWACRQLAAEARGGLLLFTDADTRWGPGALAALAAERERSRADLLTAWPTQTTLTWGERLTVPLMALAVLGYLPALLANGSAQPLMAAANGQCLLFTREAYDAIGGHERVAATVLDDVVFARAVKRSGRRLRMVDGAGLVGCRMYRGWAEARDGFGKNILAGYGGSLAALGAATIFHWLVFLGPWAWLAVGPLVPPGAGGAAGGAGILAGSWPLWPLALGAAGIAVRAVTAAATRQRVGDALLMPVSVVLMTLVARRAATWARSGGPRWKGRVAPAGRR